MAVKYKSEPRSAQLNARAILSMGVLALGAAMLAIGIFHMFQNGTCSTTGYSRYGPVPHCAAGVGWWVLLAGGGCVALGVSFAIFPSLGGLALAGLFAGLAGGCVLLGLHVSKAHPMTGFSVAGARGFSFGMAGFFVLFVLGFGAAGKSAFSALRGAGGFLALVAAAAGIAGAALLGSVVNSSAGGSSGKPAGPPPDSSPVAAGSPASLFRAANLAPVLAVAMKHFGNPGFTEKLALHPSELDLEIEIPGSGTVAVYRLGRSGAFTAGSPFGFSQDGTPSIFLSTMTASVPQTVASEIGIPITQLSVITLQLQKNVLDDTWVVSTTTAAGAPGPLYHEPVFPGAGGATVQRAPASTSATATTATATGATATTPAGRARAARAKPRHRAVQNGPSAASRTNAYVKCVLTNMQTDPSGALRTCHHLLP